MADPVLRLEPARVAVEPGGQATLVVTVNNPGTIVEGYSVDVVSTIPMPWVQVTPPNLQVYPQQEATAVITFAPPTGPGAPGGSLPFGVRVWSEVEGGGSAVAEGDLDIGSVSGLQAKLTPIASSGRWSGRHTLKVSNWGNAPARLRIAPEDPDQSLGFLVSPDVLDIPLGGEAVTRLRVRTRHPTLRGSPQRLPFQVACEPDPPPQVPGPRPTTSTPGRPVVDGAFNQKPILTRTVVAVAGLALVAGVAAAAYLLTRPGSAPVAQTQQLDAPTGLVATASPGIVAFTWDAVADVDSYTLEQVLPVNNEAPIFSAPDPDNPALLQSRIQVQTADHYCYALIALKKGATPSAPSDQVCVDTTLPANASSGPTASPSIVPISPGESPPSSPPTSPGSGATAPPLAFVSVLEFFVPDASPDPAAEAMAAAAALEAQGVDAKVLSSDDWVFAPTVKPGTILLYVDGATRAAADAVCQQVLSTDAAAAPDLCVTLQVAAPAPSQSP
ncbi:MAG: hypothetical protein WB797_14815 [Nocardioides sp.]